MKLAFYSATDVGASRKDNQDSILTDRAKGLFIVADGMGGHQGGGTASKMAVQIISRELEKKSDFDTVADHLKKTILTANKAIYNEGQKEALLRGMGTTLCLFLITPDGQSYIVNVGDSRLYLEKEGKMWQLTEDHNFITSKRKANALIKETMQFSAEDNVLTKSVGFFPVVEPDIFEKKVEKGDKYLICSDGLSGFVPQKDLQHILQTVPLKDIPQECIKKALVLGSDDNISVIVIEVQ